MTGITQMGEDRRRDSRTVDASRAVSRASHFRLERKSVRLSTTSFKGTRGGLVAEQLPRVIDRADGETSRRIAQFRAVFHDGRVPLQVLRRPPA